LKKEIRIIRPSSREQNDLLQPRIEFLNKAGFSVKYENIATDEDWTYTSGSQVDRQNALNNALAEPNSGAVVAARGGYGASDLLQGIDYVSLKSKSQKIVVGFSDISAIHCALYGQLGWAGLHAPMPATNLWEDDGPDVSQWINTLESILNRSEIDGSIEIESVGNSAENLSGTLFGGCFSVITNLIGTPYFPNDLSNHILFFEDIGESPARLLRYFNQWIQSGALDGVSAIVIGCLQSLGDDIEDSADYVYEQFSKRTTIPIFKSKNFGHIKPNSPLLIGANAKISGKKLIWNYSFTEDNT
jgi:muramoyltetrapeptide carboxypeptidase